MLQLVLDEYLERKDWPPGLGLAVELLCTVESQLPRLAYQRVLSALRRRGTGELTGKDEQMAFLVLADVGQLLPGFTFGILLDMADELEELHGPVRAG